MTKIYRVAFMYGNGRLFAKIRKDLGLPRFVYTPSRILPSFMKDKFWEMEKRYPCIRCSELYYACSGGREMSHLVNQDDPNVLDIWTLIFIEYNRRFSNYVLLPKQHIDCGFRLERVSVIQNKRSDHDTDLFMLLFETIQEETGAPPYQGRIVEEDKDGIDTAYRVVADHARTLTIALSDGGNLDNTRRGFILRRIVRRAVRYAKEKLNAKPGFISTLINTVVEILGETFPEVRKNPQAIIDAINEEEQQFLKTFSRGRNILNRNIRKLKDRRFLRGDIAWRLYENYGFPVDLTSLMAEEEGISVDMEAYEKRRKQAQISSQVNGAGIDDENSIYLYVKKSTPPTDDSAKYDYVSTDSPDSEYKFKTCEATVLYLRLNTKFVNKVRSGQECGVLLDKTNFNAEQGDQIHDTGYMVKVGDESVEFSVKKVEVRRGYIIHIGNPEGTLRVGDKVILHIDTNRRCSVMKNHTATHFLNHALRRVLGTDVDQRGSLVGPDRLRFDFTCKGALTTEQVKSIEECSQNFILKNVKVYTKESNLGVARAIRGLRANFETYPDPVRVVSTGVPVEVLEEDPLGPAGDNTSIELCGGIHVQYTGHIGDFVISNEKPKAKGIRRIVALTGSEATKALKRSKLLKNKLNELKSTIEEDNDIGNYKESLKKIVELTDEISQAVIPYWKKDKMKNILKTLKKPLVAKDRAAKAAVATKVVEDIKDFVEANPNLPILVKEIEAFNNTKALHAALKQVRTLSPNTSALFITVDAESSKIFCLSSVPKEAVEKGLKANDWVMEIATKIGGKGGGKPHSAQASGTNTADVGDLLGMAKKFAEIKLFWRELGLTPMRILPDFMKYDFWKLEETCPCGTCSELYYDYIGSREVPHFVNQHDPDVLDIWNLIFIQHNRENDGALRFLRKKHIDCGLRLERVSVIQNKTSDLDADLFMLLFEAIQKGTGAPPYQGRVGFQDKDGIDMAYRVVADHARTLTIALSEGRNPDIAVRGFVLRRILRRAVRYATEKLNAKPGFFATLVHIVVKILGETFPEVRKYPQAIIDTINEEEQQFLKTLSRGRNLLNRTIAKLGDSTVFPGDVAWRLYDTYGFPVDLTSLMAEEKDISVDMRAYENSRKKALIASRAKRAGIDDTINLDVNDTSNLQAAHIPPTDDSAKYDYVSTETPDSEYKFKACKATVLSLRYNNKFVNKVRTGQECAVLLDKTNFHGEQSGQIHDTGYLVKVGDECVEFSVKNVQVRRGYIVHIGSPEGTLKTGDKVVLHIDTNRRCSVMKNHTATHVLNYALRKVLGTKVNQRGSFVAPDRLRFDFTCERALTIEQVKSIEECSKYFIAKNGKVSVKESSLGIARVIRGLRAEFYETYPDPVKIVSIGIPVEKLENDPLGPAGDSTSIEICDGTHVHYAGHIGHFVIASEKPKAKGIRRIVALTGSEATKALKRSKLLQNRLNELKTTIEEDKDVISKSKEYLKKIVELTDEISQAVIPYWKKHEIKNILKNLKKPLDDKLRADKADVATKVVDEIKDFVEANPHLPILVKEFEAFNNTNALNKALKQVRTLSPNTSALFITVDVDSSQIFCLSSVPKEAVEKGLKANEWVMDVAKKIGGKGGGKPDSAQAFGTNTADVNDLLDQAMKFAEIKLFWRELGLSPPRLLPYYMKYDFWEMDETCPCCTCRELYYNLIGGREMPHLVNQNDSNVVDIWNLILIKYNRINGNLKSLLKNHIDCGLRLERVSVIQNKRSDHDIDLFMLLFDAIQKATGAPPYQGRVGDEDKDGIDMAYRVVADHARTLTLALSDGRNPDITRRGFVLRGVLRRAVCYATEKLKAKPGLLSTLVNNVIKILNKSFPEVRKYPQAIIDTINEEEQEFLKTLARGRKLLNRTITKLGDSKILPGDVAWRLYDNYGFPVDLTSFMAEEKGLSVDMRAYEKRRKKALIASQFNGLGVDYAIDLDRDAIRSIQQDRIPPTDDSAKYDYVSNKNPDSEYKFKTCEATVLYLRFNNKFVNKVRSGQECGVLLDKTNFHADQGCQIHDTGYLVKVGDESVEFSVKNVLARAGYIVHIGSPEGILRKGDKVVLHIDTNKRRSVMKNVTGAHVLNYALRKVLGTEVDQRGSSVAINRLRLDFTCKGALSPEQVKSIEDCSKDIISKNEKVYVKKSNLGIARAIRGLRADFCETYPDPVRVVSIGIPVAQLENDPFGPAGDSTSIEICCGTHLQYAGHIGNFVISSEKPKAKGIRRIVALTGVEATKALRRSKLLQNRLNKLKYTIEGDSNDSSKAKELVKKIVELTDEISQAVIPYWKKDEMKNILKKLKKALVDKDRAAKAAVTTKVVDEIKNVVKDNPNLPIFVKELKAFNNTKALHTALKHVRSLSPNTSALFITVDDDSSKIFCLSSVPKEAVEKGLKANEWVVEVAKKIGGKGGGKLDSAQAFGGSTADVSDLLDLAEKFAETRLV